MTYAIIILNYNVKYFTDACLQSVLQAAKGKNVEIVVADNNSTDGSRAYLEPKYPQVKFLWFDQNYGFGKAYNKAVASTKAENLLFLNPDTLVSDNILDAFQSFADTHPDFGIIGGQMIDGTGHFLPESKRGIPTPLAAFSKITGLYKMLNFKPFNQYYAGHLSPNQSGKIAVLTGALMFMKRQTFESVKGFDERYFMYGEDIDLSYTILKSGKQNYYVPTAKIIHFKGESSQKDSRYIQNFLDTTFQFYRKHFRPLPIIEFLMRQFFNAWLLLRKQKSRLKKQPEHQGVYFLGQEKNLEVIKTKYVDAQIIKNMSEIKNKPALLIFDSSYLPFSEIIDLTTQKEGQLFYRFYVPESRLLLGSDYKDALGEVVLLDD
jgi:GT2 family glycosyltransferase